MKYRADISAKFGDINTFLNGVNLGLETVKGGVEGYECAFKYGPGPGPGPDREICDKDFCDWKNQINEFVKDAPDVSSYPVDIEWLKGNPGQGKLIVMILAMKHMNHEIPEDVFSGRKPFLFFRESSMSDMEQIFTDWMPHQLPALWTDKYSDDQLWKSIVKNVREVMGDDEFEIYTYEPDNLDDSPLSHYSVLYYAMDKVHECEEAAMKKTTERISKEKELRLRGRGRGSGRGTGTSRGR